MPHDDHSSGADDRDLTALGYVPKLRRTMSQCTSFALAFSVVSINTGISTLFADPFSRIGGVAILLWLAVTPAVFCIVAVYAHLAGRIPLTGGTSGPAGSLARTSGGSRAGSR